MRWFHLIDVGERTRIYYGCLFWLLRPSDFSLCHGSLVVSRFFVEYLRNVQANTFVDYTEYQGHFYCLDQLRLLWCPDDAIIVCP